MKIAIAADHRGHDVLRNLVNMLERQGHQVHAEECALEVPCDYPDSAFKVATRVSEGQAERGILICGSGIGMSIAANKIRGIRAALVHDEIGAQMSRQHNDANVLCLSADMLGIRIIERIVETWLKAEFEGGRHARRVRKIAAIEQGVNPAEVTDAVTQS